MVLLQGLTGCHFLIGEVPLYLDSVPWRAFLIFQRETSLLTTYWSESTLPSR